MTSQPSKDQTQPAAASARPDTTRAATDVPDFFAELDGGQFERMASGWLLERMPAR